MQNDQTTSTVAPQESHDDSLVEDYVSNDQAEEQPNEEEVNSETTEHQKTAVNDEKSEDSAQAQNRKTARTITDQGKDGAKDEYVVAGQKYSSFDDAVKAVNKISGENTRIVGEYKQLETTLQQRNQEFSAIEDKLHEALEANQQWEQYFKSGKEEDRPSTDVRSVAREEYQKMRSQEQEEQLYTKHLDEAKELEKEPLFKELEPKMIEIIQEIEKVGGNFRKISPKKIFEMARGSMKANSKPMDEVVQEEVRKQIAKGEAKKIVGGNGKKPSITEQYNPASEVDEYISEVT